MKNSIKMNVKKQHMEKITNFKEVDFNTQLMEKQKMLKTTFTIVAVFLLWIANNHMVNAQFAEKAVSKNKQSYLVKGTVFDEQNQPLPGANIVLKNSKEGVIANEDGKFEFLKPLQLDDVLVFSYLGYEPKEFKITSNSSKTIDVNIKFDASDITLIGEVSTDKVFSSKPKKRRN